MSEPKDLEAERLERLIAAQEAQTNMLGRLVQVLERQAQRRKAVRDGKVRRVPQRTVEVTPRADAIATRALARIQGKG